MRTWSGASVSNCLTGTGWYGEPFQHVGGRAVLPLGSDAPQGVICAAMSADDIFSAVPSRLRTAVPPSLCRRTTARLTETTSAVRLRTTARPDASSTSPRVAGSTTSRMRLSDAALAYVAPS